jgi:hypothetical protein
MEEGSAKGEPKHLKHTDETTDTASRQAPSLKAISAPPESEDAAVEGEDLAASLAAELLIEEQRLSKRIGE